MCRETWEVDVIECRAVFLDGVFGIEEFPIYRSTG
jgi:hypothetical protein